MATVTDCIFGGSKITADVDCSHETKRHLLLRRKALTNLNNILKSRDITLPTKFRVVKAMFSPIVVCGCESWAIKKAECWRIDALWTTVLEKTLESPLDCKEIKPVNPKGNQPWMFIGRPDAEVETPVFWSSNVNSWLIGKVSDAGRDGGQKERRASENGMAGWQLWCNGHELGQTSGDSEGQRGLACYSPWGRKEWDTTGLLNNEWSKVCNVIYNNYLIDCPTTW